MAAADTRPLEVVLVTSPGCHLCDDARTTLVDMAGPFRLHLRVLDASTAEGLAVVRQHRAAMLPVVLVDGELLGWGRLSRGRLRRRLEHLSEA